MHALTPLQPLGARPTTGWVEVASDESVVQDAPLVWVRLNPSVMTPVAPNPAPNRPKTPTPAPKLTPKTTSVSSSRSFALIQELATLTELAQSIQATSQAVTTAHSLFLKNQSDALEEIQHISTVLHQIRGES